MFKTPQPSSPVVNVVAGQNAQLNLSPGPRYLYLILIATITKTALTSGFTSAAVTDALGLINCKVNSTSKRQHLASELDAIQTNWDAGLAVTKYDGYDNNFNAVADVTGTINGVASSTQRTTTYVLFVCFAEPSRDSYTARTAFGWPTQWPSGKTVDIQLDIGIPNSTTPNGATVYATGVTLFSNPAVRCEQVTDNVLGPVVNGKEAMYITHWYRHSETYANTTPVITKWPFTGSVQQQTIFCPTGDDVILFEAKGDGATRYKASKNLLDRINMANNFNTASINADRLDLAYDFDDDPMSAFIFNFAGDPFFSAGMQNNVKYELDLTLSQAVAANKSLLFISQVYRDALSA